VDVWDGARAAARRFLIVLAAVSATAVLGATTFHEVAFAAAFKEAPVLAEEVARLRLPAVEQRLPTEPVLLQPLRRIGTYGGRIATGLVGDGDGLAIYTLAGYEPLMRWDPAWQKVIPNVARAVEVNADSTTFTFILRSGLRWSDGEPFTTEDVRFWYEGVLLDRSVTPEPPSWWFAGGQAPQLTVHDSQSLTFTFAAPNSLFLRQLAAGQNERGPTEFPRHRLARYHARFSTPHGLAAEMQASGVSDWPTLFRLKSGLDRQPSSPRALLRRGDVGTAWGDIGAGSVQAAESIPTLDPWVIDRLEAGTPPRLIARRNPYYWKIDPAGQQLPYIDEVAFLRFADREALMAAIGDGALDMQKRNIAQQEAEWLQQRFNNNRAFKFISVADTNSNTLVVMFNLTHPDPARRAILSNLDLRTALSFAIDRDRVVAKLFDGRAMVQQPAPRPESRFYHFRLARQYLAFNRDEANRRLDRLGFTGRDAEGIRLDAQGRPLELAVLVRQNKTYQLQMLEMVAEDWRAVGVKMRIEALARGEMATRAREGRFEALIGFSDGGIDPMVEVWNYLPWTYESYYGPAWWQWLVDPAGPAAEEPPAPVRQQIDLYRQVLRTSDTEQQLGLMKRILDISAEQFYAMGICLWPPLRNGIVRSSLQNVPEVWLNSWLYPTPAPTNPAQYFFLAPD